VRSSHISPRGNRALSKNALFTVAPVQDRAGNTLMEQGRASRTAITRAAEALEAAEKMFADEIGASLDLCPAAKAALIAKIAAAIQAAIAEDRECPAARSAETC
jgi:hypothetical protein